ncbi:tetratricopeptide repeat protein [Archangium sp.]|uniref:tetratricopeptide repeat protein n=1 Tax=Archangium sp. TaxID=1872627 RepID=UPI00389B0296
MAKKLVNHSGWDERVLNQLSAGDLDELLGAAEAVSRKLGAPDKGTYRSWLSESFKNLKAERWDVLHALRDLGVPLATTNYDHLLEDATGLETVTWQQGPEVELTLQGEQKAILHLHGSWKVPESVILGIRDYERILGDEHAQAIEKAIGSLRTLVFVGCGSGLDDPNMGAMLHWVKKIVSKSTRPHYVLVRDGDVAALEKDFPRTGKIRAVGYGKDFDALGPFLRSLVPATPSGALTTGMEDIPEDGTGPSGHLEEPEKLPARPPYCFGRDTVLEELVTTLLEPKVQATPILGPAGIGKSTLSSAALHDSRVVARFGDRRYFVRCEICRTADELVAQLARALRVPPGRNRRERLLSELEQEPTLLILDNLETPWEEDGSQTEQLLLELDALQPVALVASVRGKARPFGPAWRKPIELKPLGREDAQRAFLAIAGEQFEHDPRLGELLSVLDGIPLAIGLLAHISQVEPNLEGIWELWRSKRTAVLERGERTGRLLSLDASYELSISSRRMTKNPNARRLLSILALLPAGMRHEELKTLQESLDALGAARTLREVGLAFDDDKRLRMLVPVRAYVSHHHPPEASDLSLLFARYAPMAHSLGPRVGRDGGGDAVRQLADEMANLESVLRQGLQEKEPHKAITAALELRQFLVLSGLGTPQLLESAREAARRMGYIHDQAHCTFNLGKFALTRTNYPEARQHFDEALRLYWRVGSVLGEAHCIRNLGKLALATSKPDEAHRHFEEALRLYQRVGDVLGEANCIRNLGELALASHEHEKARKYFEEALPRYQRAGSVLGEASCVCNLGEIALARQEYAEARQHFEKALSRYQSAGSIGGEASSHRYLGQISLKLLDPGRAKQHLAAALSLYQSLGDTEGESRCHHHLEQVGLVDSVAPTLLGEDLDATGFIRALPPELSLSAILTEQHTAAQRVEDDGADPRPPGLPSPTTHRLYHVYAAQRLFERGLAAYERAQHDEAKRDFEEALGSYRKGVSPPGEASCLRYLGEIALARTELEEAQRCFEKALMLVDDDRDKAHCYFNLGIVAMERTDLKEAQRRFEVALPLYEQKRDSRNRANCLRNLGKIALACADYEKARKRFDRALPVYRSLGSVSGEASCLRNLGRVALACSAPDEARKYFEQALPLCQKLDDHLGESICRKNLEALAPLKSG